MSENKRYIGELLAEFFAVAIIILFGDGVAAMYSLYDPSPYKTAYWGVCIVWGLGVTIAIYATGAISGTHANPAVTLSLALFRGFSWKKVAPYIGAQVLGGLAGAALVYSLYVPVIDHYNLAHGLSRAVDGGSSGVFFTHPGDFVTVSHAFWDELVLTAVLVFGIFAITCQYNTQAPQANSSALIIGLLVATIGASCGYLDAWAINPARDFGPRLFCFFAGWGQAAIPAPANYWWVPIVAPMVGGPIGAGLYQYGLRPYMPRFAEQTIKVDSEGVNPAEPVLVVSNPSEPLVPVINKVS